MYHYNDRFYLSDCSTCNVEFATKTIREMKTLEEFHECGNVALDKALGNVAKFSNDYLVVADYPVEYVKPMLSTNLY